MSFACILIQNLLISRMNWWTKYVSLFFIFVKLYSSCIIALLLHVSGVLHAHIQLVQYVLYMLIYVVLCMVHLFTQ
jgi:hypothetical protein